MSVTVSKDVLFEIRHVRAAHQRALAGQQKLLEHMAQQPRAYSQTPEGLQAYRAISEAADILWPIVEQLTLMPITGGAEA